MLHTKYYGRVARCLVPLCLFALLAPGLSSAAEGKSAEEQAAEIAAEEKALRLENPPATDRLEAAKRLAAAMNLEAAILQQCDVATTMFMVPAKLFIERRFDHELEVAMGPSLNEAHQIIRKNLGAKYITQRAIQEYALRFTVDELDQLAAFYSTSLGKRFAAETPLVHGRGWDLIIPHLQDAYNTANRELAGRLAAGQEAALRMRREKSGVVVGRPFPAFKAPTVDQAPFDSTALTGKVAYFFCWSGTEQSSVELYPKIKSIHERFHSQGLEVIGLSTDYEDEKEQRAAFLKTHPMPWTNLAVGYDDGVELARLLVLERADSFLVGADGALLAISPSVEELPRLIEKALAAGSQNLKK